MVARLPGCTIALWSLGGLRCDLVTLDRSKSYAVQLVADSRVFAMQMVTGPEEADRVAEILWKQFAEGRH